ncbi:MAG: glycosyltransferase [Verrucomicrobiota bacterium]
MVASMRILFSSTRGAGHLQPLLPYARALVARGHEVAVAAPEEVGKTVRDAGLSHLPFDHPGDDSLAPIWARLRDASEADMMTIAASEIFAGVNATTALPKLRETIRAWRPDLVLRESFEYGALVAAEAAGVRHARVAVHSISFEEMFPRLVGAPLDALRVAAGLPADGGASLRAEAVFSSFPASLDRVPDSSPMQAPVRVRAVETAPSAAPAAWAPEGDPRPLVYITFGTIVGTVSHLRSVYRTALDAVADLPVRALLTTGRGLEPGALGAIPANVHVEQWVPQRDVLPRAAALVCHGGSGTLLGGLAAGLPMVIVPAGADQPHNGRLVAAAGAGLTLIKPDADALRAAVQTALDRPELRLRARRFAEEIAAMPTIDDIVDVIVRLT